MIDAQQWNAMHDVGTRVRYFPTIGEAEYHDGVTCALADTYHDDVVCMIDGYQGSNTLPLSHLLSIGDSLDTEVVERTPAGRPVIDIEGSKNLFHLVNRAKKALREAGMNDEADQVHARCLHDSIDLQIGHDQAKDIVREYCDEEPGTGPGELLACVGALALFVLYLATDVHQVDAMISALLW